MLAGRSVTLDGRTHAVRRDLADIRLAEQVFAPHYAVPMPRLVAAETPLVGEDSMTMATLAVGDVFEVLEFAGDRAWGIATGPQLVGYVTIAALRTADAS